MAYTIKNDATGAIVYDPRLADAVLVDPELTLKDNAVGTFTATMFKDHADYTNLAKRRTIYSIYKNDAANPIWKGVLVSGTDTLEPSIDLYFEDFLGVLRDSMYDPFTFQGTPAALFQSVITAHNAQVQSWQRVTAGVVTVTDPNNYINRSSETELSSWEVIQTRLIDTLGGHLRMRYTGGTAYVDYLEGDTTTLDPNLTTSTQVIELGENLKDFSRLIDTTQTYTACIPKGAELDYYTEEGEQYRARLTIESVNSGSKYLVDTAAVALYGFRCAPLSETTWNDVTVAANLKTKGQAYLSGTAIKLTNTIKLTAYDLSLLGVASDSIGFLDYVRVSVSLYSLDAIYLLTEIKIPLDDPSGLTIGLGETFLSMADRQTQAAKQTTNKIESVQKAVSDAEITLGGEIEQTKTDYKSLVDQTSKAILAEVSRTYTSTSSFNDFQEQIATRFTQTEEMFGFDFKTVKDSVTDLNGSVTNKFSEQNKYIRFVDGNIIIGIEGNALTLKLANDRIKFLQNNVEIAYFSSGRLYVDNIEALTSLTLGSYAFKPNSFGGMSLKYSGQ